MIAVGLAGSWARGTAQQDSDVDLVLLTRDARAYTADDAWAHELGASGVLGPRDWGAVTERRLIFPSGLELDFAVGTAAWAAVEPLDEGTRRVVRDGLRAVYDPQGLLAGLVRACRQSPDDASRT